MVTISCVSPRLGEALVWKCVDEGCEVGMFARTESYLRQVSEEMNQEADVP